METEILSDTVLHNEIKIEEDSSVTLTSIFCVLPFAEIMVMV